MATPIVTPLNADPEEIFGRFAARMQALVPGWEPADGSPNVWMAEGFAEIAAELENTAAAQMTTALFRWYGTNIAGLPPIAAVAASSTVTITGTAGQVVAAGYNIALADANGTLIGFKTTQDATLTAGTAALVPVVAAVAGEGANDLTGTVTRQDSLAYVTTVTLDSITGGGSDAEDDDAYITRLVAEERLRTVAPILARDFAQLSKRVLEVDRCAYLDGYNTADGTSNNALMVTLTPVQADGSNVSPAGKQAIIDQFAEDGATPALINFVVNVADPHETAPTILFTGTAAAGWDPVDAKAGGEAAVKAVLDRAEWGQPQSGEERAFDVTLVLRRGAIFRALYDFEGLHDISSLTINGSTTADLTLTTTTAQPVPITANTGTVTGTVT